MKWKGWKESKINNKKQKKKDGTIMNINLLAILLLSRKPIVLNGLLYNICIQFMYLA